MKKTILLLFLMCITTLNVIAQLPYAWTPNVNPGWSSTNSGSGGALNWSTICNAVTTNCTGNYSNNQNTTYTSFILDASCTNATTLNVSFFITGNAEPNFDFLFIEYSLDGGTTWINPYGLNVGLTGNAGIGLLWTLPSIPTSNTLRFRFNFRSDGSIRSSGYRITNFQIVCDELFPIELIYFGTEYDKNNKDVIVSWKANTTELGEYFIIEKSLDSYTFDSIGVVYPTEIGTNNFQFVDESPIYNGYTYYRLKMVENSTHHYSNVSVVEVKDFVNKIIVHPNPFNDYIKVQNLGDYYGLCEIKIYDVVGKEVISQSFQFGIINKMEINTKDLSPGIYNVVVKTNGSTETYKIIK